MIKYARLRERCLEEEILAAEELSEPPPVTWEELSLVHSAGYLDRVRNGTLSAAEQRRIGFPWSPQMVERSRRSAGATLQAALAALEDADRYGWGIGANLAGGTHHAHTDRGEGFCVFNDAAVAVRTLQRVGRIARAAILDCDVHQGNGTAGIFAADPSVFTFSVHGAKNYPFRKERSSLDVALPDGAGDDAFLAAVELHLPHLLADFRPDLAIYLAGADPYADDRFGRLAMSKAGLEMRDRLVLGFCHELRVPTVVVMAGGYARDTEDTVDIHRQTVRTAAEFSRRTGAGSPPPLRAAAAREG